MLVDLSVMEQRYQAVMAVVQDGCKVVEVADRLGVARQSVHNWIARYEAEGLPALADRSHRPESCAHQSAPDLEALTARSSVCIRDRDRAASCTSSANEVSVRHDALRKSPSLSDRVRILPSV